MDLQWVDALPAEGRMGGWVRPLCQDGPFLGEKWCLQIQPSVLPSPGLEVDISRQEIGRSR